MAVVARQRSQPSIVLADCQVADEIGDMVRVAGDEVAGLYQVARMEILNESPDLPAGMIIEKYTSTRCVVQMRGEIKAVYTGLTPGKQLFVNSFGKLTHDVPISPISGVRWVHPAAQALSNDTVLLRIQGPTKLNAD